MEHLATIWEFFREGFLASLVVGLVLPLVGALLLLRRTAFLGVAVPQFSAAGLACGLMVLPLFPELMDYHLDHGHPPMEYLFAWAAVGAGLALWLFALLEARDRRGSSEARLAAGFAIATALSILFLTAGPIGDNFLSTIVRGGQLLMLDLHGLEIVIVVFAVVFAGLFRWRRAFLLVAFDPDAAVALGHSLVRYERLQTLLVGLAIAGGIMTVGPVLVFGLLFLPPMGARRMARTVKQFVGHSILIGVVAVLAAWPLSLHADWPYGPATVAAAAVMALGYQLLGAAGGRRRAAVARI